jgi:peroxiredoxin
VDRKAIDGRAIDAARLDGKTVVVKFFAQYCEPCTRTLPAAQSLSTERPDVVVIGVAEDEDETVVRGLVSTYGLSFPIVHDRGRVLAGRFRVTELPATFVAGADGKLRWVGGPEQRPSDLERAVEAVAP